MTAPDAERIRVLIVDDHKFLAEALSSALTAEPDMEVVGVASSVADVAASLDRSIDVVLGLARETARARPSRRFGPRGIRRHPAPGRLPAPDGRGRAQTVGSPASAVRTLSSGYSKSWSAPAR